MRHKFRILRQWNMELMRPPETSMPRSTLVHHPPVRDPIVPKTRIRRIHDLRPIHPQSQTLLRVLLRLFRQKLTLLQLQDLPYDWVTFRYGVLFAAELGFEQLAVLLADPAQLQLAAQLAEGLPVRLLQDAVLVDVLDLVGVYVGGVDAEGEGGEAETGDGVFVAAR